MPHLNLLQAGPRRTARGFTLVELMVTIALIAFLVMLALPSFTGMVRNTQVRTMAETLQNGLRQARTDAIRLNRQTVFFLTATEPRKETAANAAALANSRNWAIHKVPRGTEATEAGWAPFLRGGALSEGNGVTVIGPAAVCFGSNGRLVVQAAPGVAGANCTIDPANLPKYALTMSGADRRLSVWLGAGGEVRMCDPDKVLSAERPDGCPAPLENS